MARIQFLLLLLGVLMSTLVAAGGPTFCKCTCGKNSTIIPLGPASQAPENQGSGPENLRRAIVFDPEQGPQLPSEPSNGPVQRERRSVSTSCSECTKAFCLSQGIDFCKNTEEEDVTTMCFKRDSNKDKIIVWGFIAGTSGLLGWATFKKVMEWRQGRTMGRQVPGYAPMPGNFR